MQQYLNTTFFWVAFIGYSCAVLSYLILIITEKKIIAHGSILFMFAAFVNHTIGIALRTFELQHAPLANMFEYLVCFAWFAGIGYFILIKRVSNNLVGALSGAVIFMLMAAASLLPKEGTTQLLPALRSYWLLIHVSLAAASEGAFAVGFISSVLFLMKLRLSGSPHCTLRFPKSSLLDMITYRAIAVGYPLFTVGALFAGAIWAHQAWGSFWSWDPKETSSLVVWIVYSAYLHLRLVKGTRGTVLHILSIAGFIAAVLTFFSSMVLGGLHAY